ncbi:hypothetical protein IFM89_001384 [Coptis chinensis]|uniref:Uncharacterized protein n=1 Tax=Coptis chinensis TaxID=261450 RepID=A0A835HSV1_9MAGN|nr:hypothetical protein IFM89_001384 [Coptis chinensis]
MRYSNINVDPSGLRERQSPNTWLGLGHQLGCSYFILHGPGAVKDIATQIRNDIHQGHTMWWLILNNTVISDKNSGRPCLDYEGIFKPRVNVFSPAEEVGLIGRLPMGAPSLHRQG